MSNHALPLDASGARAGAHDPGLLVRVGRAGSGALRAWSEFLGLTPRNAVLLLLVATSIAAAGLIIGDPPLPFADFRIAYYPAGAVALAGQSLTPLIVKGVSGFVNLPIVAYAFAPFALVPIKVAAGVFLILGLAATACSYMLLVHLAHLRGPQRRWLLLLFAANGPLLYSLKEGNTSHIVLLCLTLSLWLLRDRRGVLAGITLAIAALIKLPLLLFGAYLVWRRCWDAAGSFVAVLLAVTLTSVLVLGVAVHRDWLDFAILQFSHHGLAAFNVQSVTSVLLRLRDEAPSLSDWRLYVPTAGEAALTAAITLVLYGVAVLASLYAGNWKSWFKGRHSELGTEHAFMLFICLALLTSPVTWTHYYAWLLILTAFFLGGQLPAGGGWLSRSASLAGLVMTMPLVVRPTFGNPFVAAIVDRVGVSTYFFGGVFWFAIIAYAMIRQGARGNLWLRREEGRV